ncbi:hypothethical protein [Staphylococcus caprae]|uniref:Hypothethical protein n=1 Tax=Staphylococcus caprae TaxID=29380 RepID=A0ABN5W2U6_9STAP|nr:hypothethical protein [Staphylococcus caprae]BBD92171.1 hypothethical protein [Staphylococcus caprae]BBD94676.1 hypothetical protein JMUB898_1099 [Staphylococcus caprae]
MLNEAEIINDVPASFLRKLNLRIIHIFRIDFYGSERKRETIE